MSEKLAAASRLLGYTEPESTTVTTGNLSEEQDTPPASRMRQEEDVSRSIASRGFAARIFSFPVMCMFLLAAVIFALCAKQFAEPDVWWHLRSARDLLLTHNFSPADTYSFTAAGSTRLNYEWLSEVAYFLAYRAAGLRGILSLYFAVLVAMFAGVYYLCCTAGSDCKNATLPTLLGIFLAAVSIGPRTLLFGWLCMVLLLLVLDRFRRTGRGIWVLPLLFAVWINFHPSWVFGMVVFVLTISSGLVEGDWGLVSAVKWHTKELRSLALVLATSSVALFVNPLGYKLVLYPFDFLFRQQSNMSYVEEWQPLDFSTGDGKIALLTIFALLAATLLSRRRWRLQEVLLTAFALWMSLSHTRFLFLAGLILPPILAQRIRLFPPYDPDVDKPWLNAAIMACVATALVAFFPSQAKLQQKVDEQYPTEALRFMERQHLSGRIFNQYLWGGYMEWMTPELKPFIDGRADIFVYNGVLDDHRRTTSIDRPMEVLDKYRIDYLLLQPNRPLTYLIQHSTSWRSVYADKVANIFERVNRTTGN